MKQRLIRRIKPIILNALQTGLRSFQNIIISLLIIRLFSEALWGEIVYFLIVIDLAFIIIDWGSKNYLMVRFSEAPHQIQRLWQESFISRSWILVMVLVALAILPLSPVFKLILFFFGLFRYFYNSFEAIVAYRRDYIFSLVAESGGLLIVIIPIIMHQELSVQSILTAFAASYIFRALSAFIYYHRYLWPFKLKINFKFLLLAFPFLLMGISGVLQSRADLYIIATLLPAAEVAQYQVLNSLLLFSFFFSSWLLTPFEKNIYRLPEKSLVKLQRTLIKYGFILSLGLMAGLFLILHFLYQFYFEWYIYLLSYLYLYSFYFYLIKLYQYSKNKMQRYSTAFSFAAGIVNIILSFIFIPVLGIAGALLGALVGQLLLIILFYSYKYGK